MLEGLQTGCCEDKDRFFTWKKALLTLTEKQISLISVEIIIIFLELSKQGRYIIIFL